MQAICPCKFISHYCTLGPDIENKKQNDLEKYQALVLLEGTSDKLAIKTKIKTLEKSNP